MKPLNNIPVLVTGATGFVGSRLSELLATKYPSSLHPLIRGL